MRLRSPLLLLLTVAAALPARALVPVTSWPLAGAPTRITAAPNGYLYWTQRQENKLGYRSPGGTIGDINIPTANAWPEGIAAAPDGTIWFAEHGAHQIGRYNPYAMFDPVVEFPLQSVLDAPVDICAGPEGSMWFTMSNGKIGRITLSGSVAEWNVPTASAQPDAIALGAEGALWFTEPNIGKLARFDGSFHEYDLQGDTSAGALARGSDGSIWFVSRESDLIGRAHSVFGVVTITYFTVPPASHHPEAIAAGSDGALWFTSNLGTLTRLTTYGNFNVFSVGAGTTITSGRDGALWLADAYFPTLYRFSMSGDTNKGSGVNVGDVFYLINFLFAGGDPPL